MRAEPSSRCAIYTVAIGSDPIFRYTLPAMRHYAARIGADFIACREASVSRRFPPLGHPAASAVLEKIHVRSLLRDYERVLYVDGDVLIAPEAPDIFETHPNAAACYLLEEGRHADRSLDVATLCEALGPLPNWPRHEGRPVYYNSGVMLFGRDATFLDHLVEEEFLRAVLIDDHWDQTYFNLLIARHDFEIRPLAGEFNWMNLFGRDARVRRCAHFIHYAGEGFSRRELRFWDCFRDFTSLYAASEHPDFSVPWPERIAMAGRLLAVLPRAIERRARDGVRSLAQKRGARTTGASLW